MKRNRWILIATLVITPAIMAQADVFTFTPTSGGVNYAINADGTGSFLGAGYYVSSNGVFDGSSAISEPVGSDFEVAADSASYADAGIVLFFDGSLTLKQLASVSILSTGAPLSVNLWLDTSGDDQFFKFSNPTYFDESAKLSSLNGDDYYGSTSTYGPGVSSFNGTASFSALIGGEPGGSYTLAQFQNGDAAGISGDTPVALWIGLSSTGSSRSADIQSITVTTNPVPLIPSAWSGLVLLGGLAAFGGVKRFCKQTV